MLDAEMGVIAGEQYSRQIMSIGVGAPVLDNPAGATSIDVPFPTTGGAVAGNVLTFLEVALKPGSANLGSVATPAGWSLVGSHIGGGYGATIGTDVGNTRIYLFSKQDNAVSGSVTVGLTPDGADGVAAAGMSRIEKKSGTWQPVVTAVGEATVNTNIGSYVPSSLLVSPGDCLIYGFAIGDRFTGTTTLAAGTGLTPWSPSLALGATSALGYGVNIVLTGRRAQRGIPVPTQVHTIPIGEVCRGPMIIARYRVR